MMVHDFKPETDEDRKKRKQQEEANRVFKNVSFVEVTSRIADLILKMIYSGNLINKDNAKNIGEILFWIENNENGPVLMYNQHPRHWNKDNVVWDLEREEMSFFNRRTPH